MTAKELRCIYEDVIFRSTKKLCKENERLEEELDKANEEITRLKTELDDANDRIKELETAT